MLLLGIDFETTGLDFEADRITEIGAVLWDTDLRMPMRLLSVLVRHPDAPPITQEITDLTGITQRMLDIHGKRPEIAFTGLCSLLNLADAAVAHNGAGFDRPMLDAQMRRFASPSPTGTIEASYPWTLPWIDTCMDVEFPAAITTRKLVHLAAEHGFLNPFSHRAVFDVLTMLRILDGYPLEPILASAAQPIVTLQAMVSFADNELAKARGYRWKAETKQWLRKFKAHKVEAERAECGFQTAIVEAKP